MSGNRRAAWEAERAADGQVVQLPPVRSRVPSKWLLVDLETGDVWVPVGGAWRRPADIEPHALEKAVHLLQEKPTS